MINWNKYPYTDFHELNLDWILSIVKALDSEMNAFVNVNTIKYADPLLWNITTQYEQNTLVQDANGNTYLSKKAIPTGITLDNTDYWLKVADFAGTADIIRESIAIANDGASTTSSSDRNIGDLVWLSGFLNKVLRPINIGDAYINEGNNPNVKRITVEELIKELESEISTIVQPQIDEEREAREVADALLQSNINIEANARETADSVLQNAINAEANARENAINAEANARENAINAEANARETADSVLQSAINAEANARETADAILEAKIEAAKIPKRKYIVICDSYGNWLNPNNKNFVQQAMEYAGVDENSYYNFNKGSSGFTQAGEYNFLRVLQDNEHVITDKNSITDIIVCGLANDQNTYTAIGTNMQAFINYAKAEYINARIIISAFSHSIEPAHIGNLSNAVLEYKKCIQYGAFYLDNSEYVMLRLSHYVNDNVHPSATGIDALSRYFAQYINSGSFNVSDTVLNTMSNYGSNTITLDSVVQKQENGIITLESQSGGAFANINLASSYTVPIGEGMIDDLFIFTDGFVFSSLYNNITIPVLLQNITSTQCCNGILFIRTMENNKLCRVGIFTYSNVQFTVSQIKINAGSLTVKPL